MIRRLERELACALLPGTDELPPLSAVEGDFWPRFDAAAPAHLRLGMGVAAVALAGVLPRLHGHLGSLGSLAPDAQDRVLSTAERLPLLQDLLEVAKIVACFAYFDDDGVQRAFREPR